MLVTLLPSLKLTAKAPENGWLEDDRFLLGWRPGRCELLLVVSRSVIASSNQEMTWKRDLILYRLTHSKGKFHIEPFRSSQKICVFGRKKKGPLKNGTLVCFCWAPRDPSKLVVKVP